MKKSRQEKLNSITYNDKIYSFSQPILITVDSNPNSNEVIIHADVVHDQFVYGYGKNEHDAMRDLSGDIVQMYYYYTESNDNELSGPAQQLKKLLLNSITVKDKDKDAN